ncbi:MAG: SulP family inorganic anion transporter, partial [Betaproteobacteria bacterium]|nr:SulP family inorganic anion transporter [Betaproteobacteria bacterium]
SSVSNCWTGREIAMRFLPISRWSHEFSRSDVLRADLLAGLTGAIVVLPQGIAFSMLAGLPAQFGLYAAMVPCILAALFGSSRAMVTGPANAISLTTMALIAPLATVGSEAYISLVLTLSFLVGVSQCLIGLSGAGKYVDRVPHSVIVGFTVGASVLIINSQLGSLLGMDLARGMSVIGSVERIASEVLAHNLDWHAPALVLVTLFVIALWRPLNKKVPSMLVAVLLGSLVAMLIESIIGGTFRYERVATISEVLPPLTLPDLRAPILNSLVGPALVMLLLASTEAMAIARSVALRRQDTFCANQEFLGQGIANIGGAFFSSYPASGSFNRSGVNVAAGAQ